MTSARALALTLCFFLDVQVRAATSQCWNRVTPCAVSVDHKKVALDSKAVKMVLKPGSLIEKTEAGAISIVKGTVLLNVSDPATAFRTPFAKIWCADECVALIDREAGQVTIKSLGGNWRAQRLGDEQEYAILEGTRVLFTPVTDGGQAGMEFAQSLPWEPTVKEWAELYPGDKDQFKADVARFREVWNKGVESATSMQEADVGRTIAAYDKAQAQARARRQAQEREDAELRRLFREKNYINP